MAKTLGIEESRRADPGSRAARAVRRIELDGYSAGSSGSSGSAGSSGSSGIAYPESLKELLRPPGPLYAIGRTELLEASPSRLVAIVGTRDASPYGMRVADELARAFAAVGIGVVSGLARGIDSAAHRGALEGAGDTIAVLGTGVNVPYPAAHRALHAEIGERGLLVSEYEPGTKAFQGSFPLRNRIIAALAKVTIVVEAPYKSGAVNTATHALELGRTVAAVPGQIDSPRSAGCNQLLRDGAQVISSIADALGLFGLADKRPTNVPSLTYSETRVWDALAPGEASVDNLGYRLGMSIRQVVETVGRLQVLGIVQQRSDGLVWRK